jgi:hypothetical protein
MFKVVYIEANTGIQKDTTVEGEAGLLSALDNIKYNGQILVAHYPA